MKTNINQIKINNDTNINNVWLLFKKLLTEGVEKFVPKNVLIAIILIEINGNINYLTE